MALAPEPPDPPAPSPLPAISRLRGFLIGAPKNLFDPRIHQHLALIAFFAWVGLGSDGLSSSCYGPEEVFRQLGAHRHLALYLVAAMIGTVFLISASYSHIIEQFPTGGGGYLVATKLLGATPGVISGSALVVDYVLTIAISVAAGCDAIYSFVPARFHGIELLTEYAVVAWLILLNLRGVKESVMVLTPIFLVFIATHIALIGYGVLRHAADFGRLLPATVAETHGAVSQLGWFGVGVIVLRAFSLGGGTYTGIEAVSNGVGILREPRVDNGRKTMLYMATSLAFTAGGILLCYLLNQVQFESGKTLNASLWELLTRGWRIGALDVGPAIVTLTLVSEGALLFVAAQTGFLDGPRTLAAMSTDEWVPKRFKNLSERLVTQNGVLSMGLAAAAVLYYTKGAVTLLVVMYSINVFLTFTLSQLGMARHWLQVRKEVGHWRRRFVINSVGALVTGVILAVTTALKFREGGWSCSASRSAGTTTRSAIISPRSTRRCSICRSRSRGRRRSSPRPGPPRSCWSRDTTASACTRCSPRSASSRVTSRTSCSSPSGSWTPRASRAWTSWARWNSRCAATSSSTTSSPSASASTPSTATRSAPTWCRSWRPCASS
jgi:amino acid transporter